MKNMNSSKLISNASGLIVSRSRQAGVTLIELLIALIIGLLGTIVIFTVYQNAEGYKRTTVATGDAQTNASIALFALERYIRTSGSGIATTNEAQVRTPSAPSAPRANLLLGCPLSAAPVTASLAIPSATVPILAPVAAASVPVAPVRIIDGSLTPGGNLSSSDVLVIMAGNADISTNPTPAAPITAGSFNANSVGNTYGWRLENLPRRADIALFTVSAAGGGAGMLNVSNVSCTARRLTAMNPPPGAGSLASGTGSMTFAPAVPLGYAPSVNIHNIGPTPYFLSIGVNAQQQLVETNFTPLLTQEGLATQRVLADGIISLQAQYGIDDDKDDVIDRWVEPTGDWSNPTTIDPPGTASAITVSAINKIKAIRLAILARSAHYEPPNRNTGVCDATPTPTAPPVPGQWFLLPPVPLLAPPATRTQPPSADVLPAVRASAPENVPNASWQCFRYRTYETVVPLINMIRSPL
jgi:type IV pilus assembly protein PilW